MFVGLLAISACSGESPSCEVVETSNGEYCVYRGPITETGYVCPDEMPNLYREEGFDFVACGASERPNFDELGEKLDDIPTSSCVAADTLDIRINGSCVNVDGTTEVAPNPDIIIAWGADLDEPNTRLVHSSRRAVSFSLEIQDSPPGCGATYAKLVPDRPLAAGADYRLPVNPDGAKGGGCDRAWISSTEIALTVAPGG